MKKFLIALCFTLCACAPDTEADDQYPKAESLVVKGFHLGMNEDEFKTAFFDLFQDVQYCDKNYTDPYTGSKPALALGECRGKDITITSYPLDEIRFANQKLINFRFNKIETIFNSKEVSGLDFVKGFYDHYKLKIYFPKKLNSFRDIDRTFA